MKRALYLSIFCLCGAWAVSAQAALFEDTDARKQLNVLTESYRESLKNTQKAILELSLTNDKLKEENQELRGKLEELQKQHQDLSSSQKNYYADLDVRLKKLEPQEVEIEGVKGPSLPIEKIDYDSALKDFQNGDLPKANQSLSDFVIKYPYSPYVPLVKYWLTNTQYALKDYKPAIATAQSLIKQFPDHPRVPESYLTIANCQIESGQKADAKKTLELVIKNYPDSKAAPKAALTLVKLK